MEKMRFNKNKVLGYGLIILLSLLSIIGGLFFNYNIGFELKEKLWIATFIGALLIMIYNFIQLNLDRKTYRNFLNDNDYFNNVILDKKRNIKENIISSKKEFLSIYYSSCIYTFFSFLASLFIIFIYSYSFLIIISIGYAIFFISYFGRVFEYNINLLNISKIDIQGEDLVSKEFDEIYKIIEQCISGLKRKKKIILKSDYSYALIAKEYKTKIEVSIGYFLLKTYSKKELEAKLIEELVLINNKSDVDYFDFENKSGKVSSLEPQIYMHGIIFCPRIIKLETNRSLFSMLLVYYINTIIAECVKKERLEKENLSANFKQYTFQFISNLEVDFVKLFKINSTNGSVLENKYLSYKEFFNRNKKMILENIDKCIDYNVEFYNVFGEKMKNYGVKNADYNLDESNEFLLACRMLETLACIFENEDDSAQFDNDYNNYYLKIINEYKNVENLTTLDKFYLLKLHYAYYEYDKALELAYELNKEFPENGYVKCIIGLIEINYNLSINGVEHLTYIINNKDKYVEFAKTACYSLQVYYNLIGDLEKSSYLIDVYDKVYLNDLYFNQTRKINKEDTMLKTTLDEEVNEIIEFIKKEGYKGLALFSKENNNIKVTFFIVFFDSFEDMEANFNRDRVISLFRYFSNRNYEIYTASMDFIDKNNNIRDFIVYLNEDEKKN